MPDLPIDFVQLLIFLIIIGGGLVRTIYQALKDREEPKPRRPEVRPGGEWEFLEEIETSREDGRPARRPPDPLDDPAGRPPLERVDRPAPVDAHASPDAGRPARRPPQPPRRAPRDREKPRPTTPPPRTTEVDTRFEERVRAMDARLSERLESSAVSSSSSSPRAVESSPVRPARADRPERKRARIAGVDARSALIAQILLGPPRALEGRARPGSGGASKRPPL